jgi:hypothetical protein
MATLPVAHFVLVDEDAAVFDSVAELLQDIVVRVGRDPRAEAVVPTVHTADQVLPPDPTIREQRAPVKTTPIQGRASSPSGQRTMTRSTLATSALAGFAGSNLLNVSMRTFFMDSGAPDGKRGEDLAEAALMPRKHRGFRK